MTGLAGLAALVTLVGCGGGDTPADNSSNGGKPSIASGGNSTGGSTPTKQAGPGGGAGFPGAGGAQTASAPKNVTPPPGARLDPFKPYWNTVPPPPPVLSFVTPVRIADDHTTAPKEEPGIEIREVPTRRIAGILNGNGVYALIDDAGKQDVIRPGQKLDDGYEVVLIGHDSVTLKKKVGSQTFTQIVPLTDAGSVPNAGAPSGGSMGGGGKFGGKLGGPQMGGLSGAGGGKRGGGGAAMGNAD